MKRAKPMNRGTSQMKRSPFVKHSARANGSVKTLKVWKSAKPTIFRAEWLLALVRQLECMNCGIQRLTEAAHSNQLRFGKAKSIKSSDATAMALCKTIPGRVGCHNNHDQGGKLSKQEWKDFEYRMIAKTILTLLRKGMLKADEGLLLTLPSIDEDGCEAMTAALVAHIENGRIRVAS